MKQRPSAPTIAVRAGIATDTEHGAVVPPIHLSTTYTFAGLDQKRPYDYSRSGNPTRDHLGSALAELEGGAGGVVTSSGMSAVTLVLQLLGPEDRVIVCHDCYGGTHRLVRSLAARGQFQACFVDFRDVGSLEAELAKRPRMVWVETPSNPLLRVVDVRRVCRLARRVEAMVVVDNTFLSPALQRPIELGADVVVHSTTKYLNGHSDVVGGAVIAADQAVHEELDWWGNCLGLTASAFDSFLTLRGLRTLHARMRVHSENADAVVSLLTRHPAVRVVHHPSLVHHPGHRIAKRQQSGFGAMVSFELHGGLEAVETFVDGTRLFTLAESLGGVESLVAHPATMTHAAMDAEAREAAGINEALLRLSVGIESAADLVSDLEAALDRAQALWDPAPETGASRGLPALTPGSGSLWTDGRAPLRCAPRPPV